MNFTSPAVGEPTGSTTNRWRLNAGTVQFTPSEDAVVELLRFLGFSRVEKIPPTAEGLEHRYYDGTRGTFLALR